MNGFPVKAGRPAGGYHYCGNSMRRVFRPGDVLVLATVPFERLRCGDVICFRNTAGKQIVHRIVGWRPDGAVTQGDNNDCVDAEPVAAENYFGRVEAFQRGRRRRRMRNGPAGMRQFHWNRCRRRCRLTLAGWKRRWWGTAAPFGWLKCSFRPLVCRKFGEDALLFWREIPVARRHGGRWRPRGVWRLFFRPDDPIFRKWER